MKEEEFARLSVYVHDARKKTLYNRLHAYGDLSKEE